MRLGVTLVLTQLLVGSVLDPSSIQHQEASDPNPPSPALRFGSPLSLCTGCWEAIFHDPRAGFGIGLPARCHTVDLVMNCGSQYISMENGTRKCWLTLIGDILGRHSKLPYLQIAMWPENTVRSCAKMTPPRVAIHQPLKGFISGPSGRCGWLFQNQRRNRISRLLNTPDTKHSLG